MAAEILSIEFQNFTTEQPSVTTIVLLHRTASEIMTPEWLQIVQILIEWITKSEVFYRRTRAQNLNSGIC